MSRVPARCALAECGRRFTYDPSDMSQSAFPFCSFRCKGVDLGHWVDEDYKVPSLPDTVGEDEESADALRGVDDEESEH